MLKQELLAILRAMLEAENDQPEEEQTPKESREYQGAKGGRGYYERSGVGRSLLTDRPS